MRRLTDTFAAEPAHHSAHATAMTCNHRDCNDPTLSSPPTPLSELDKIPQDTAITRDFHHTTRAPEPPA